MLNSIEICAGGGGQALGLEQAGFRHQQVIDIDSSSCATLRHNRPDWSVVEGDIAKYTAKKFEGIDLLAGGIPCPPFSIAGKQLGENDERNLFPHVFRLIEECRPKAVMIENVRGILGKVFDEYRWSIKRQFKSLGYVSDWKLLNSCDFGVSQLRPRVVIVALAKGFADQFDWPKPHSIKPPTVGELLYTSIASRGWPGAKQWRARANDIAPTIVGGSKKHGGPDLGPTRAKKAWQALGVNGKLIAAEPPARDFDEEGLPQLTVPMVGRLQGFPPEWIFTGSKTAAYRQVGNAFSPPVALAVGSAIYRALTS